MAESKEALRDTGAHAGSRGIPAAARVLTPQQLPHGAAVRAEQEHPHAHSQGPRHRMLSSSRWSANLEDVESKPSFQW